MATTTQTAPRMTGHVAIRIAEALGLSLSKYADPTEGAREELTVEEAQEIAAEDPGLIWIGPAPGLAWTETRRGWIETPEGYDPHTVEAHDLGANGDGSRKLRYPDEVELAQAIAEAAAQR